MEPLTALLKKNAIFKWSEECAESFEELKAALSDHVLLNAPRGNGMFVIATDASNYGVGAALLQIQDQDLVVLEFASKTLTGVERRWPTYEKEAYAIRWAIHRFEDYVKTGTILVVTDHSSLQWMATATSGKVRRWALVYAAI